TAIPDGIASEFAIQFYYSFTRPHKTLKQAFDEAASTSPKLAEKQSVFLRGTFATKLPDTPCAWGLYHKETDILKWVLVNRVASPKSTSSIDRQKAFLCDRDQYRNVFDPSFNLIQGL